MSSNTNLKSAVQEIISSKNVPYRKSLIVQGNKLMVSMQFKSKIAAQLFAFSWAYGIRQVYDGGDGFTIFLSYYDNGRLMPFPLHYKPHRAPDKNKIGYQRPERRLTFF